MQLPKDLVILETREGLGVWVVWNGIRNVLTLLQLCTAEIGMFGEHSSQLGQVHHIATLVAIT
jgi:hypothetical protein